MVSVATSDEPRSYEDLDTTAQSMDWSMTREYKTSFGRRPNVGIAGFADVCTFLYRFSLLRFDDPGIRSMHTNNVFVHDWNAASGTIRLMESSKNPLHHTCMNPVELITLQILRKQGHSFSFECHSSFIYTFLSSIEALRVGVFAWLGVYQFW